MKKLTDTLRALLPSVPKSADELRDLVGEAADTAYLIDELTVARDKAVEEAVRPFDSNLIQAGKKLAALTASLKAWANGHRGEFNGKQSYAVSGHALAFRVSPGKLVNATKLATLVEAILAADDDELVDIAIAVKPALDKAAIKAALEGNDPEIIAKLTRLGFKVEKPEEFRFEPARVS